MPRSSTIVYKKHIVEPSGAVTHEFITSEMCQYVCVYLHFHNVLQDTQGLYTNLNKCASMAI